MSGFIHHIIARHLKSDFTIQPRLPGRFENTGFSGNISLREPVTNGETIQQSGDTTGIAKPGNEVIEKQQETKMTGTTWHSSGHEKLPGVGNLGSENTDLPISKSISSKAKGDASNLADPFEMTPIQKNIFLITGVPAEPGVLSEPGPGYSKALEEMPSLGENNAEFPAEHSYFDSTTVIKPQPENTVIGYLNSKVAVIYPGRNGIQDNSRLSLPDFSNMKQQQEKPSVIKVSIGRIEVRAITDSNPVKVNRSGLQKPKLSLDDYLNKRNKEQ